MGSLGTCLSDARQATCPLIFVVSDEVLEIHRQTSEQSSQRFYIGVDFASQTVLPYDGDHARRPCA